MDWYEPEVRALEAVRILRPPTSFPPVFYGSSTIRLWNNLPSDLGCRQALNLGFGGSTLEACSYFFDRLIVPEQPGSLILYAGDNDLGDGRLPHQVASYFQQFADKVERFGVPSFCFISIKPSPARFHLLSRIREANNLIREDMKRRPRTCFIDLFDYMLQPDNKTPRPELFDADGLHMSPAGYRLWSNLLLPYRNRMFIEQSCAIQSAGVSSVEIPLASMPCCEPTLADLEKKSNFVVRRILSTE